MNWRLKGLIQKVLSVAPGGLWIAEQLKRTVGRPRRFEDEIENKLSDVEIMFSELQLYGITVRDTIAFEIGSGWYPTFPVCLYLAGAQRVITVDLVRHLQPDLLLRMVERIGARVDWLARISGEEACVIDARHAHLKGGLRRGLSIGEATDCGIDYRAPTNAASTGLPPATVDLVLSNSVLEHIPRSLLDSLFAESRRILKPGGHVFHSVNCGDHYAYWDAKIGQLNYLQYSTREWDLLWNNNFQYQNRLRAIDFLELTRKHGFEILFDNAAEHANKVEELSRLPKVAHEFLRYSPEQLCVTSVDFIGRKTVKGSPDEGQSPLRSGRTRTS